MGDVHDTPKEYLSLPSERNNYAEMYGYKLSGDGNSCPEGGIRPDSCRNCTRDLWNMTGLTVFSKVRLEMHPLRIIGDDFTYSRQVSGHAVAFGKAGDCFSAWSAGCPMGRFSIDLGETVPVRLVPNSRWATQGDTAHALVHLSEDGKRVSGKCGGRCGTCQPENGLFLEFV